MSDIRVSEDLVAYCGLYCGACGAFLKGRCPGCHDNVKAGWCKIRTCNMDAGRSSCAACTQFPDAADCKMFNNLISKLFGLIFRSDRNACIQQIKAVGLKGHAERMAASGHQSIKRT